MNNLMNDIRKYIYILNAILVSIISMILVFTPNLKLFISNKDMTNSIIIFVILILLVVLSLAPLKRNTINTTIISLISLAFITIGTLYSFYDLLMWINSTIEGSHSFRFLTIIKTATLENKLTLYHQLIREGISVINQNPDNIHLAQYLEKSPLIMEPYSTLINNTPYQDLKVLVTKNITLATNQYELLKNVTVVPHAPFWTRKRIIIASASVTIAVVVAGVVWWFGGLAKVVEKGFGLSSQESLQTANDMNLLSSTMKGLSQLSNNVVTLGQSLINTRAEVASLRALGKELSSELLNLQKAMPNIIQSITNNITDNTANTLKIAVETAVHAAMGNGVDEIANINNELITVRRTVKFIIQVILKSETDDQWRQALANSPAFKDVLEYLSNIVKLKSKS